MSSTILSTKKLSPEQQKLLVDAGLDFVHYNAIAIRCLDIDFPDRCDGYIFTSQNGVRCFLEQYPDIPKSIALCVGSKTAQLLSDRGFKVMEYADNATKLAQTIIKKYAKYAFIHPCGTLRREELPKILKKNTIKYKELLVYDTVLKTRRFQRHFDGVLFFSPSAVQSYTRYNDISDSIAFCIGKTTAAAAKKTTGNIVVADEPTIEHVVLQSIATLGPAKLDL